ncbi:hypothetical protein ABIC02_007142, partial [Bradyrhizobium sp. RT5a]
WFWLCFPLILWVWVGLGGGGGGAYTPAGVVGFPPPPTAIAQIIPSACM